jgi:hypothetical protein
VEEPQAPAEAGEAPKPKPEIPIEGLATGKEPWRTGSGCGNRLPAYGCAVGVMMLIAVLIAGTSMMRKTVWLNFERSRSAVMNGLPQGISPAEANRTRTNLNRFRAVLERQDDPYEQMGEFVTRVRELFADGRITDEELELFNLMLERWIEESGIPPMQLGFRISDFEFRISAHPPMRPETLGGGKGILSFEFSILNSRPSPHDRSGWVGENSEFRIPNSEFV